MPGCFEKSIFELEAFSYSIRIGLSLAKQLALPQKMFVSSAKFTILISWSPVCTHVNGGQSWLQQQQTETLRLNIVLIHIWQMKLSWKSRNGNKRFQATLSKALAEFY